MIPDPRQTLARYELEMLDHYRDVLDALADVLAHPHPDPDEADDELAYWREARDAMAAFPPTAWWRKSAAGS